MLRKPLRLDEITFEAQSEPGCWDDSVSQSSERRAYADADIEETLIEERPDEGYDRLGKYCLYLPYLTAL
jgi:hypothetical protein